MEYFCGDYNIGPVEKTIYTMANNTLRTMLKDARLKAGLTQKDIASRLRVRQSFVSKYEAGERRLDLFELRSVCRAVGISLSVLVKHFEDDDF